MDAPINLNKARKAKAKSTAEAQAAANRVKFGRTKAVKQAELSVVTKSSRNLDDHKRD